LRKSRTAAGRPALLLEENDPALRACAWVEGEVEEVKAAGGME
jgi:hypothetical protein